jgi:P27 family predicted phage terminase small subunit
LPLCQQPPVRGPSETTPVKGGQNIVPPEVRRREGDRSHRPAVDPALVGGRVDENAKIKAPPRLSKQMRAVWQVVIDDMRQGGILDRADLVTVESFAVAMGRAREIRDALAAIAKLERDRAADEEDPRRRRLAELGLGHLLADTVRGSMANPLLAKEKDFITEARQLSVDLGLSPRARAHLGLDAKGSIKPKGMHGELERTIGASPRFASIEGGRTG